MIPAGGLNWGPEKLMRRPFHADPSLASVLYARIL